MRYAEKRPSIYLDNAASTHPKPEGVYRAVDTWLRSNGGNAGRSGHRLSVDASELLYSTRVVAGKLFSAEPENVIFCSNTTHALNTAIMGLCKKGTRIILSDMEHNSVYRPVYMLKKWGICDFDIFDTGDCDESAIEGFLAAITPDTSMAVVTHVSNVTGRVLPIEEIYSICQKKGIILIVDAAQSGGMIPVNGGDIICLPGHKGLYGPQGTGLMVIRSPLPQLLPLTFGGTGTVSAEAAPEVIFPESFEAGTVNCPGIAGLKAGLEFLSSANITREFYLADRVAEELACMPNITLHRSKSRSLSVVPFSVGDMLSETVSTILDEKYGIAVRGGLQCAPLCHKKLGTLDRGVVRASLGAFTKESDIYALLRAVREISRKY